MTRQNPIESQFVQDTTPPSHISLRITMTSITPLNGNQPTQGFLIPWDPQTLSQVKDSQQLRVNVSARETDWPAYHWYIRRVIQISLASLVLVLANFMQAQTQSSTYKSNQGWFFAQLGCFIHPLFFVEFLLSVFLCDGWVSPPALRPQVVRLTLGCHQHNDISLVSQATLVNTMSLIVPLAVIITLFCPQNVMQEMSQLHISSFRHSDESKLLTI